jgi:peptidoglycan hydrolase-like protein with peptidoglycan-binding domain
MLMLVATPPAPVPAPPPAAHLHLTLQHVQGHPRFAITGQRVVVRGVILPYVAGERVSVRFLRDGAKAAEKTVTVQPVGNGAGQFHLGYSSPRPGIVSVLAAHSATAQQGAYQAKSASVRIVPSNLSAGASGPAVRLLQTELNALHYAVPLNGSFDDATGRAVIAYRKLTGLARVPSTNAQVFHLLQQGAGGFRVRYRGDGKHVEADLTRQVMAEIAAGGHVQRIYTISSGKPSTPTVIGRFTVYSKTFGTNGEGMVDSNYFIRGYAIHGYADVPTYAASHGCLRVPIPDAAAIYSWVQVGDPVDVYNENGGGSQKVRRNAGP